MPENQPQVVQEYLAQSRVWLARLDMDLGVLGREEREPGVVERVEGALRSIRSGASMLAMEDVEQAAARAEVVLGELRNQAGEFDRAGLDALAGAVQQVRDQVGRFEAARLMAAADELIRTSGGAVLGKTGGVTGEPDVDPCAAEAAGRVERAMKLVTDEPEDDHGVEPMPEPGVLARLGEVVAESNRVAAMAGRVPQENADPIQITREVARVADRLYRATEGMKDAVLGERATTLAGVLAECGAAVANVASRSGREVRCDVVGGEMEIDGAVLGSIRSGLLGAATELASRAAGPCTMTIGAELEGWHVRVWMERDGLTARAGGAELGDLRDAVEALGGSMVFEQQASGAERVEIRVPRNLAFVDAMVVRIGETACAIPTAQVDEVVMPTPGEVTAIRGVRVVRLKSASVPLVDGREVFGGEKGKETAGLAVVVRAGGSRVAMEVDRALGRQEIVVRPLDATLRRVGPIRSGGAGGDGNGVLVVDVPALVRLVEQAQARKAA